MTIFNGLAQHWERVKNRSILSLFEESERATQFSVQFDELLFDFSKTHLDAHIFDALIELAQSRDLIAKRTAMFEGQTINETEKRSVLHTALRNLEGRPVLVNGSDIMTEVLATLEQMRGFARAVRSGELKGQGGSFTDVVNIGIGGSDLGPAMATLALAPDHDGPRCHFLSNIDGAHATDILQHLNPETTLVIIASKTFTTIETMTNAQTVKAWMSTQVSDLGAQFVALSTAYERTQAFGILPERVFGFADWVGGRYSMWGPIGLSLMIAIGPEAFDELLRGAQSMDRHFCEAPLSKNIPTLLALIGLWHHQVCGYPTRAVLPYDQRLSRLPAYLQQLEMESNGKRVGMDGVSLSYPSGPVVWGEPGTNGQHAFYQLIHQGTQVVPCEFLVAAKGREPKLAHHHQLLVAHCFAQSEALMRGRSLEQARALMSKRGLTGVELERQANHRVFEGNRPSTTLIYPMLTPYILGQILALYEHRVFVEGVILGLNSFDQWGVELGKELATALASIVAGRENLNNQDGSTRQLIEFVLAQQ